MAMMVVAAAAAFSAYRSIRSDSQQAAQFDANSKANDFNAAVLRQRASDTTSAYNQREEQQRRSNRLDAGKRAAAAAQSGLGFGGSNADAMEQSDIYSEMDALNIRYEGQLESRGMMAQAESEDYYGRVNKWNRTSVRRGLFLNAASSALSSGASAYALGGKTG